MCARCHKGEIPSHFHRVSLLLEGKRSPPKVAEEEKGEESLLHFTNEKEKWFTGCFNIRIKCPVDFVYLQIIGPAEQKMGVFN